MTVIKKHGSTTLPSTNNPAEISKSILDLLAKINLANSAVSDNFDAVNSSLNASTIISGSNSNGSYIMFPEGTMICRTISSAVFSSDSGGPLSYQGIVSWTFPIPFISNPVVPGASIEAPAAHACSGRVYNNSASSIQVVAYTSVSGTYNIEIHAIGRWK